ncbi:MAG: TonB-dependent receptor domain-containing protein [Gemmatimonadota bacterium]
MKRFSYTLVALSLAASPLQAQTPGPRAPGQPPAAGAGEIRGSVVDAESNTPIASAAVAVRSAADSSLVAGAIVRPDGSFRIEGLRPGTYILRLTMIGYASRSSVPITLTETAPLRSLGNITLTRQAVEVAAVEATAERQVVIAPDRNIYRVKDVAPAAANASDVLENVPSVAVDQDGKVSLRGNENVVVQINGRPTPIRGAQLAGYLKQLPSNMIERVEVVPNPSAKQDPEGMAGIINIVMKQGVDLGRSGGLTLLGATNDRYSVAGNFGYQAGKIASMFTYGFNFNDNHYDGLNNRTRLGAGKTPMFYTLQNLGGTDGNQGHNLGANLDYSLTRKAVVSGTLTLNRRSSDAETFSAYTEQDGSQTTVATYDRVRDTENDNWLADGVLAYKRTMTPQKHELSGEVRFNHQADDEFTALWRQAAGGPATQTEIENNTLDAATRNLTAQLDYTRQLSDKTKLETGYKGNLRMLDRDYVALKDAFGNGNFVRGASSSELEFDESVNAVYAVVSHAPSKKVDLQAGLRAEYASRDFQLANSSYPYDYTSLYPSGIVNFNLNDKTKLKGSYSRRVRRPGTQELNPFPVYFDQQNVFLGNPNLNPEYTNSYELSLQRSGTLGTLQVSPFYRRTSNILRFVVNTADTLDNREITSVTFQNLDKGESWGADVNTQFKFSPKLSGLWAFNVFKMVTDGGSASLLQSDAISWMTRANLTWVVSNTTTLLANGMYRGPQEFETGKFSSFKFLGLAVRQKLQGDKLVGTLRVNDPFKWNHFMVEVGDDNVIQLTDRKFNAQGVVLMLQYTAGQRPRMRERRQEEQQGGTSPFGGN